MRERSAASLRASSAAEAESVRGRVSDLEAVRVEGRKKGAFLGF